MATQRRGTKKAKAGKAKKAPLARTRIAKAVAKPKAKPKAKAKAPAKRKPAPRAASKPKKAATAKPAKTAKTAKAAKAKAAPKPAPKPAPKGKAKARRPLPRRDGTGHLDLSYAKKLRALSRASRSADDTANAFVRGSVAPDDLAEELAEETVAAMTSGEYESAEARDSEVPEESGGPFVPSTASREFAEGTDLSNPKDAEREPFPRT